MVSDSLLFLHRNCMRLVKLTLQHTLNAEVSMKSKTTFVEGRLTVQKWGSDFMEAC